MRLCSLLLLFALLPAAVRADDADEYVMLLSDKHPLVRKQAALALGQMGKEAKKAVPALRQALTDGDPRVRAAAAEALESLGPSNGEAIVIKGHAGTVFSLAFSPDGKRLACASGSERGGALSGEVRFFDPATGQQKEVFRAFTQPVRAIAFSPDGKQFATGADGLRLWAIGRDEDPITLHGDTCNCIAFSPGGDLLVATRGLSDSSAAVWSLAQRKELVSPQGGHAETIKAVAFSPDKKTIASCEPKSGRLWDGTTGKVMTGIPLGTALAFSPDGKRLAVGGLSLAVEGRHLYIYDVENKTTALTVPNIKSNAVAWSADGKMVATGSTDGTVRVWAPKTGQELLTLKGHDTSVRTLAFSPDSKRLASGSEFEDATDKPANKPAKPAEVRIWELPPLKP